MRRSKTLYTFVSLTDSPKELPQFDQVKYILH